MTPIDLPLPAVNKLPTAGEAVAAKKMAEKKESASEPNKETSQDFEKTMKEVSAPDKGVKNQNVDEAKTEAEKPVEPKKQGSGKDEKKAVKEQEAAPSVKENLESRLEQVKKERKVELKKESAPEPTPEFGLVPEPDFVVVPETVAIQFGGASGGVAVTEGFQLSAHSASASPMVDSALQAVRGGGLSVKNKTLDAHSLPFDLRPAAARTAQSNPAINRAPVMAQSSTFSAELAERVGTMRLISRAGATDQVRINLMPRDLGNLDIRLQVDGENRVHMMVTTETEAAKDLLKNQISQLRDALVKQGMEFGDVDIQVDIRQREQGADSQAGMEWGGDRRSLADGGPGQATVSGLEGEENPLILGKVVRTADGGMSVFI
ncbi:MAG: flagellar hook-length control protein FliK [Magnetococcales bacterium]|nr:flagellar hook-length control protein FliK [Magnetococcales bacterium]